jgi:hypothetical protein
MQSIQFDTNFGNRLRFAFEDAIICLSLPGGATFGDIADTLNHLAQARHGVPRGIVVNLPSTAPAG